MGNKLPSIVSDIPSDLRNFLDRVRESLEAISSTGAPSTTPVVTQSGGGGGSGGSSVGGSGGFLQPCGATQYPTAPTGLEVDGAFTNIILDWDAAPYCGHAFTEIWAARVERQLDGAWTTASLDQADYVGQTTGEVYAHAVEEGAGYYYWIRHVNIDGVRGAFDSVAGTLGYTERSPGYLLELLTGSITESQLFSDLGSRIDMIDDPETGLPATRQVLTQQGFKVDGLQTQYTVKIDNNGYVTGFGLASTPVNGVPFSEFAIRADRFYIAAPGIANPKRIPFVVQATQTVINGEPVDPGVYIDAAWIQNGVIGRAKIGDAAIDSAKIANAAIVEAKIANAAITSAKIKDAEITSAKILDGAITNAKILDAAITTAKIQDAAITSAKIKDASITAAEIQDAAITRAKIKDGEITRAKIELAAIDSARIGHGEITTANIRDLAVDTLKLAGQAVTIPAGGTAWGSVPWASIYMSHPGHILVLVCLNALRTGGGNATLQLWAMCNGQRGPSVGVSMGNSLSGAATAIGIFYVGAGMHSVGGSASLSGGNVYLGTGAVYAIGVKR